MLSKSNEVQYKYCVLWLNDLSYKQIFIVDEELISEIINNCGMNYIITNQKKLAITIHKQLNGDSIGEIDLTESKQKKYYCIWAGHQIGIYYDEWSKIKPFVEGYPKNGYKGLKTMIQAFKTFFNELNTRNEKIIEEGLLTQKPLIESEAEKVADSDLPF